MMESYFTSQFADLGVRYSFLAVLVVFVSGSNGQTG